MRKHPRDDDDDAKTYELGLSEGGLLTCEAIVNLLRQERDKRKQAVLAMQDQQLVIMNELERGIQAGYMLAMNAIQKFWEGEIREHGEVLHEYAEQRRRGL